MSSARYSWKVDGDVLFIEDASYANEDIKTVTNDINAVLREVSVLLRTLRKTDLDDYDMIYRDSLGRIDGIHTTDNVFDGFYYINETVYVVAKSRIKSRSRIVGCSSRKILEEARS